jgi:hypothetical protein
MFLIGKCLHLWADQRGISSGSTLLLRLLRGVAVILLGVVTVACIVAMVIIGGLWYSYGGLIEHGYTPALAGVIVAMLVVVIGTAIALLVYHQIQQVNAAYTQLLRSRNPISGVVSPLLQAFAAGISRRQK